MSARPLKGRMFEIAAGLSELPAETVEKYRRVWQESGYELPDWQPATERPRVRISPRMGHSIGVGTMLARRIEWLTGLKAKNSTCACKSLADQMDRMGIAWCEAYRVHIVDQLLTRRTMLADSLARGSTIMRKAIGWAVESKLAEPALRAGANWLLDEAIAGAKEGMPENVRGVPMTRIRHLQRNDRSPFHLGEEEARFITSEQMQTDVKLLMRKIPHDITAIAGIARSGLSVATMVSMYTQLPLLTIRQTAGDVLAAGNGWRLGGNRHINPREGHVLVIDDTVMTGNSLRAIQSLISRQLKQATIAAVYVNPLAKLKPDIWAVDLPWPHLLEWNLFNSVLSPNLACDFDGILCRECRPGEDDDGNRYRQFLRTAEPIYLPRKVPIPLIVTARLECYRKETEEWLHRHGIKWQRLVMHPARSLAERQRDDVPAFKARHFSQWARSHSPRPAPVLFVESCDQQARRIAGLTNRMVVCPVSARVY